MNSTMKAYRENANNNKNGTKNAYMMIESTVS